MQLPSQLDVAQVKAFILGADISEKLEIARFVDEFTLPIRVAEIIHKFKDIKLTDQEIIEEVDSVREQRYSYRQKKS